MKTRSVRVFILLAAAQFVAFPWGGVSPLFGQPAFPSGVKVVAPDGIRTQIYSEPGGGEILDVALNGVVLEVVGKEGDYVQVRLPESQKKGYVLESHTEKWEPPPTTKNPMVLVGAAGAVALIAACVAFIMIRRKRAEEIERRTQLINKSIKEGEDLFRSGDYPAAIESFKTYLALQGGEVRNPDVYRRLSLCYLRTHEPEDASAAWDKMAELGGAKTIDDYSLGVDIMSLQGNEAKAAQMYETILSMEFDEDRLDEIKRKLIDMYRRLKDTHNLLRHAVDLLSTGVAEPQLLADTAAHLIDRRETGMALKANHKDLIQRICDEFLEENNLSPDAEAIYLKALEYNRTNPFIHRILAKKYQKTGEFKKAVSELTILHQIDKDKSEEYIEEAAKLYVENEKTDEALKEGNPKIIRKIAQIFIARSHVHPEAVAVYEKVLESQPNAVGVHKILSTVYLTRGDLPRYMAELRILHELDGRNKDYLTDMARCVIDNNMIEETMREGNKSLNTKIIKQLIKKKSHDDQTIVVFNRLLEMEPQNTILRRALAGAYNTRGETAEEFRQLLVLSRLKPDEEEISLRTAEAALDTGQLGALLDEGSPAAIAAAASEIKKRKLSGPDYDVILFAAAGGNAGKPPTRARRVDSDVESVPATLKAPTGSHKIADAPTQAPPQAEGPPQDSQTFEVSPAASAQEETPPTQPKPTNGTVEVSTEEDARAETTQTLRRREKTGPGNAGAIIPKFVAPVPSETPLFPQSHPDPSPTARSLQQTPQVVNLSVDAQQVGVGVPVTTFVSAFERDTGVDGATGQMIDVTGPKVLRPTSGEDPLTTFVSASERSRRTLTYREDELFRPNAGGAAYATSKVLSKDAWGAVRAVVEVTTSRDFLMRTFEKGLMKATVLEDEAMDNFCDQIVIMAGNMSHPNIAEIEERVTGPGRTKGVIHAYRGHTLDELVREGRRPPFSTMVSLARQLVEALVYAGNFRGLDGSYLKLTHGNLQGTHVFISDDFTTLQLAGFGYSPLFRKMTRSTGPRWRDSIFNPKYMPPEAFRSKDEGGEEKALDVYAFGIILFQMVTWRAPFDGPDFDDFKFQHTRLEPERPSAIDANIPQWLDNVIMTCLEKDTIKRWSSFPEIQEVFKKARV